MRKMIVGTLLLIVSGSGSAELVAPTITITAKSQPSEQLTAPQSATTVQGRKLERARGMNLTDAIASTPGVAAYTSGNFVSKPVVRGLTSNRVLIVADGIRQETQQWGDEHAGTIDSLSVDRYEVLRGPNGLLYGSDALGGVIATTTRPLLRAWNGESKVGGVVRADGFTASRQAAGSILFQVAHPGLSYSGHMTRREAGDYTTPLGRLANTAAEEFNGGARIGWMRDDVSTQIDYTHADQRIELAEDDPTETPYQKVLDDRAALRLTIPSNLIRWEISSSFSRNRREEFESEDAPNSALNLLLKTSTLDLRAHHEPMGLLQGTIGLSAFQQINSTRGEETLIPNYSNAGVGGYVYEELPLGRVTVSAGLRGDGSQMRADENAVLGNANETLKYSSLTGALGAVYHVSDPFALALNVGRGYRSPTAFELFSNGVHEGTRRFELGNRGLKPEQAFNIDVSARWASDRVRGEITFFRNLIDDFIFSQPSGVIDAGSGFEIFNYTQGQAELLGSELSIEGDVTPWLRLSTGYDLVRGRNRSTDLHLPLMPADRLKLGILWHADHCSIAQRPCTNIVWIFQNPYASIDAKLVRKQTQIDPNELPSGGYALWDFATGWEMPVGETALHIDMGVNNLFDKRYADHLSRNKSFAPDPGRNIFIKLTLPFGDQ